MTSKDLKNFLKKQEKLILKVLKNYYQLLKKIVLQNLMRELI